MLIVTLGIVGAILLSIIVARAVLYTRLSDSKGNLMPLEHEGISPQLRFRIFIALSLGLLPIFLCIVAGLIAMYQSGH